MKRHLTLFIILLLATELSFAQNQANWWFFGQNAGLHFDNGIVSAITTGALNTSGGCSAISDTSGNLLFYTDGVSVYTSQNTAMPNGFGLLGGNSSTQSAQIVPLPGSSNLYYIFTAPSAGDTSGFRYSVVDMTMNGGLGDVFIKNKLLRQNLVEKLTAVSNADGSGYWVLTHEWGSNAFYAYPITASGLDSNAVVSNVGTFYSDSIVQNAFGQLKFSPDGKKIAAAIGYQGIFELLDFDNATGEVSNPVDIETNDHCYGVEFSANNSKLYVTYYSPFFDQYYLDQYDISSGDTTTIINSKTNLSTTDEQLRALQLGPDHKIYVAPAFTGFLGTINNPDSAGTIADYTPDNVDLAGGICSLGLPGFVQSYFNERSVTSGIKPVSKLSLNIFPNPAAGKIYFNLPVNDPSAEIEIRNSLGQFIFSQQHIRAISFIDVSRLPQGVYLVRVKSSAQNFEGKFLKQ